MKHIAAIAVMGIALPVAATELGLGSVPVLSGSRVEEDAHTVPAAVTKISGDMLRSMGVHNLAEALKLVPGFNVTRAGWSDPRVTYHAGATMTPRRINLLINGAPGYYSEYAIVFWEELPISINDIERIEVVRGPSAATHGANSFNATVNVITKHPVVDEKTAGVWAGNKDRYGGNATFSIVSDSFSTRLSLESVYDEGFDGNPNADGSLNGLMMVPPDSRRDGVNTQQLGISTTYSFSESSEIDSYIGYRQGLTDQQFVDSHQITNPVVDFNNLAARIDWNVYRGENRHQFRYVRTEYERIWEFDAILPLWLFSPRLGTFYDMNRNLANSVLRGQLTPMQALMAARNDAERAALIGALMEVQSVPGGSTITAEFNQNYSDSRDGLQYQFDYVISDELKFVIGTAVTNSSAKSETFLGGSRSDTTYQTFGQAITKFGKHIFNTGLMVETDDDTGSHTMPRLAYLYELDPYSSIRVIYNSAVRTPDGFEQHANWQYTAADAQFSVDGYDSWTHYYRRGRSPGFEPETIESYEVGYSTYSVSDVTRLDVRVFYETMDDLVSGKLSNSDFDDATSDGWLDQYGVEIDAEFALTDQLSVAVAYTYLDAKSNDADELLSWSWHSGSTYLHHQGDQLDSYFGVTANRALDDGYLQLWLATNKQFSIYDFIGNVNFRVDYFADQQTDDPQLREGVQLANYYVDPYLVTLSLNITF